MSVVSARVHVITAALFGVSVPGAAVGVDPHGRDAASGVGAPTADARPAGIVSPAVVDDPAPPAPIEINAR